MNDVEFLKWIYNRLILIHGEDVRLDYMRRLDKIIEALGVAEHE